MKYLFIFNICNPKRQKGAEAPLDKHKQKLIKNSVLIQQLHTDHHELNHLQL